MEGGSFVVEVHIVQKGDTLWKISRQYGISFEELKRVNAHLANPDYIVPGMKIFLPNQPQEKKDTVKKQETPVKKVEKVEDLPIVEKHPVKEPQLPKEKKEEAKKEKAPIPLPKPPTITKKPVEKEKVEEPKKKKPPVEKPKDDKQHRPQHPQYTEQPHQPGPMQQPMIPMQPFPVFGIPCGWMPIYDADCYTHYHPRQMHPMPTRPMHQLPVEESMHHQPHHPPVQPTYPDHKKTKEPQKPKKDQNVQPRPIMPQLNEPSLSVPNSFPRIESSHTKSPVGKKEEKLPFTPPSYEVPKAQPQQQQPKPPVDQGSYYPNWPHPGAQSPPTHAGESTFYGMNEFPPMQPAPPMQQPHPFCSQCQQPVAPHAQFPMYYPAPHYWRGSY